MSPMIKEMEKRQIEYKNTLQRMTSLLYYRTRTTFSWTTKPPEMQFKRGSRNIRV